MTDKTLRALLLEARLIDEGRLAEVEAAAAKARVQFVHALHRLGVVEDRKVARLLSSRLGLERVDLDARKVHEQVLAELSWRIALRLRALPLGIRRTEGGATLYVAMSDPSDTGALEELEGVTGMEIRPLVAEEGALDRALRRHYPDAVFPKAERSEELLTLEPVSDEAPPVVIGAILEEPAPAPIAAPVSAAPVPADPRDAFGAPQGFLTDNTSDVLALYHQHMGPNARQLVEEVPEEPASATTGELLEDTTREVLRRFAPSADAADAPDVDDLSWLKVRRLQAGGALPSGPVKRLESLDTVLPRSTVERPRPSTHEAPTRETAGLPVDSAAWRPELGAVAVVSPDERVRAWLSSTLAPVAVSLHAEATLARVREVMRKTPLELVVLVYPRREPLLEGALRDLQEIFNPPKVLVVASDRAFDGLAGVDLRLPPPPDVEALPGELLLAMKRIRA